MSDLRVFVVLFVRSLDIRANWFSAFCVVKRSSTINDLFHALNSHIITGKFSQ